MKKVIETERLILRPIILEDATDVFEWVSDPVVNRYLPYALYTDIEQVKEWIKSIQDADNEFAFYVKEIDKVIGTGGISYNQESKKYELGYNINQKFWGKGYATEAAKAMIKWAYDTLGAREFSAEFATDNVASGKVLEKCGFRFKKYGQYSRFDGSETFDATFVEMNLD